MFVTRSVRTLAVAVAVLSLVAIGCSKKTPAAIVDFYSTPSPLPTSAPGTIVRIESMAAAFPQTLTWRVMYTSTGVNGEPVVVTGMVFAPSGAAPSGGRVVVSWAHPTTGIVDDCAPSRIDDPYGDVQGLQEFLAKGWVVVATDYQGLGTDGPHPYLVGTSEAHGTIDIVRAAAQIDDAHASNRYFVFGHSQGGQAVLFAGQMQSVYGKGLTLLGVAAAAPAGLLVPLFDADRDTMAGAVLGSYAVVSWHEVFGYDTSNVIVDGLSDRVHDISGKCVVGGSKLSDAALAVDDLVLKGRLWKANPATTTPWSDQFAINTAGQTGIGVPVLITQGTADKIIQPATTAQLVSIYRSLGTKAVEQEMPGVDHMKAGKESVPYVVPFFAALAG